MISRYLEKQGLGTDKGRIFTDIGLRELKKEIRGGIKKEK